jgi:hypothetical protein
VTGNDCLRHCYGMFSMKDTSMAACANAAFQLVANLIGDDTDWRRAIYHHTRLVSDPNVSDKEGAGGGELHGAASGAPRRPGRFLSPAWVLSGQSQKEVGDSRSAGGRAADVHHPGGALATLGLAIPGGAGAGWPPFFSHPVRLLPVLSRRDVGPRAVPTGKRPDLIGVISAIVRNIVPDFGLDNRVKM